MHTHTYASLNCGHATPVLLVRHNCPSRISRSAENPKNDRNGPIDEAAGSANSYLALAALNAAAALPLAVAPHTVADFLFGAAALPHDFLHEPLLRILATGFAGASTAAASLNVSNKGT